MKIHRALFLLVLVGSQAVAQTTDPTISTVNVDGRKVRIRVAGTGSPAVVFESGFGGDTLDAWAPIFSGVATGLSDVDLVGVRPRETIGVSVVQ